LTSLLRSPLTPLRLTNASERYLRALGTFTRWDILVKELYLPFKAHTRCIVHNLWDTHYTQTVNKNKV
ncbi:hypothetical protein, partial [Psychroflexus sp. MES1-P1E]|uniref:hypothetical protein n=1 Tax=Psychroflexus sp. MES1-P1E TaxID=2058320 RepID=UPI001C60BDF7